MVKLEEPKKLSVTLDHSSSGLRVVAGIPAYNEEKSISRVVLEAQKYANIVVVCDDGSTDLTSIIAERLGAVVIRHDRNLGYGAALQSLFTHARALKADVLVTVDSDGQHDPSQIPLLVKPLELGIADVVLGSRFLDKAGCAQMPVYRQFGIKVITKLVNGAGKNCFSDSQSGFRAYSKSALNSLLMFENGMAASIELLNEISSHSFKVCEVPISCKYGKDLGIETSTKHPITHSIGLLGYIIKLMVEDRPLVFLGLPGSIALVAGVLFGVWMMNIYALEGHIVTNIALASIGFVFLGCFMLSTSITLYAISRLSKRQSTSISKNVT